MALGCNKSRSLAVKVFVGWSAEAHLVICGTGGHKWVSRWRKESSCLVIRAFPGPWAIEMCGWARLMLDRRCLAVRTSTDHLEASNASLR